ncbi:MAG TPA: SH3 domain-containing protein, partial [Thermomicrobiales bacterium]|nr:SH3 domain-containing protein [Thermomicrobiales bacterium]
AAPAAAPAAPGSAKTTTEANLRSGPTTDAAVLAVLPAGAAVSVDGAASNGFVPVTNDGVSGWVAADLISGGAAAETASGAVPAPHPAADAAVASSPPLPAAASATATAAPAPAATKAATDESTGIVWPVTGGAWEVVQGYNNGTHTNRSAFAQYKYSLDWARVDGDTAGQPVYAPVSGTVQWVDRGSGGLLIDAGNGYGVALFHLTLDGVAGGGRVERGQRIGVISGPGGDGYMSMTHFEIAAWRLNGRSHESVPFVGPNAIAGQEFPDSGGTNQYMGMRVTP